MLIDANHLALTLNNREILKDVSLHMEKGEIYGLLGPNGAGKSTTIALLLGLYHPDRGEIALMSNAFQPRQVAVRQRIGVMPEMAGFYPWMSAKNYLVWYAGFYGGMQSTPRQLLQRVGLEAAGDRAISQFSRGMKQRLALARALLHAPELLILDEPTNGLDPRGRREIHDLLLELAEQEAVGILLSTHLLDDVERLCTRIGIIDQGRTVLEDTLGRLLDSHTQPRFRLHMLHTPENPTFPPTVRLLSWEEDWWTLEINLSQGVTLDQVWQTLLQMGWHFDEIHAQRETLEDRYLELTLSKPTKSQEVAA